MCMDTGTFLLICNGEETSLEHVATLIPGSKAIKLIDIFGKSTEIVGTIEEIDLLNKRIVLA